IAAAAQLAGLSTWEGVYLERPLTPGEQLLMRMMDSMGATQVAGSWRGQFAHGAVAQLDSPLARVLPSLPHQLRQQWQAMINLVLPVNMAPDRLRMMMVCDSCLGYR